MDLAATLRHTALALVAATSVHAADDAHAGLFLFPDVSATHIVFSYGSDLWTVPRDGGTATPLASPPGTELFPRFSDDGATIAYVGNYDGDRDIYTIPTTGGVSHRVTHHPTDEMLCGWTSDGRLLFSGNIDNALTRAPTLYTVDAAGGLPEALPVPYGGNGAIDASGRTLVYNLMPRDFRNWKRYTGGRATDVWLFDLVNLSSRRITDWQGTDTLPMWHDGHVYYLSDRGESARLNIWHVDPNGGEHTQLTTFADFDVRWPSMGPGPDGGGEIVFNNGTGLFLLDLQSGETTAVPVSIPGDRPQLRTRAVDVSDALGNWHVSPTGKRAVAQARGDIWTLPASDGVPRNLTRTSGAAELDPAWSPDGRWIAYFSDASGEYELTVVQSDGKGDARQLTAGHVQAFLSDPMWSPDSELIVFADNRGSLHVHDLEADTTRRIVENRYGGATASSWSHDGEWLAFVHQDDMWRSRIALWERATGAITDVTSGMFGAGSPTFDRKGEFLYFVASMDYSAPQYDDEGMTFVYADTERLHMLPLRADVASPFLAKSDEETWDDESAANEDKPEEEGAAEESAEEDGDDDAQDDDGADDDDDADEGDDAEEDDEDEQEDEAPLVIDLDGFAERAILLPLARGPFGPFAVAEDGALLYVRRSDDGPGTIHRYDAHADEPKEETVIEGANTFWLAADGKTLLAPVKGAPTLLPAKADAKGEPVVTADMVAQIDPRAEWSQLFDDAWRRLRDFFYDPNMHGVDWDRMREHYGAMVADASSRADVGWAIRELLGELNVGHAYYSPGEADEQPATNVGLLGVDFALVDGAYQIARIYGGAAWDTDARGPLSQPGLDVHEGDFIHAVNGVALDTTRDPWAAFIGLAGRVTALTVGASATPGDDDREILVTPIANESALRYRWWVERNRAYVEAQTNGRVGYIHVPDTGVNGQNELFRQFVGQRGLDALIIDERFNGGGQVPTRFIELLNRPATNAWAIAHSAPLVWPPDSHQGPKCMLINPRAGSGGDAFPYYFRQAGLGKLIGRRTWGGLVGIGGVPSLIDGTRVTAPNFAFYENDGTWGIEGWGVDPDIEVWDDPAAMQNDADPQLDAAIALMLEELVTGDYTVPPIPPWPDRSGLGLPESDR